MHSSEIRYFLVVATTGSLSAASEHLFVAVSAISRQIQRLEERLGVPLFERHARGMVLNDAGRILENHVRKSMMDMDLAVAEIQGLKGSRRTLLRIGCTEGMAFDSLPTLFSRFRRHDADMTFHLSVGSAMQVSQMIRNGEVDIALQFSLAPEQGVNVELSLPAPLMLLMSAQHPLAEKAVQLADLEGFPLALPDSSTTLRQLFDLSCRMSGTFLEPALCCNNFTTLYHYALQTPLAVTACSFYSVMYKYLQDPIRLKLLNIKQLDQRSLQIQTLAGKHHPAPMQTFLDFMISEMQQGEAHYLNTPER
ncbi:MULTISPECIES: LysR family transcriptional regulator [unclassified Brenneria]|uniref:LysR family transcriptional regulator n=1 Tax=unclassified Brenneria TaxID=2634434 RepID=UPI0029C5E234|nr:MULTISPECIES: LysR family transcriptional regulator [unclassified Brenneria]MDX5626964.1 LysR family transcriptional regulator [Brenneria sp. L3-3Z]MDX5693686.1 LysR family transcriptional regulator [Brenneria sp. L4-2C]MEE3661671.1 LysR family transcriptional regulator [Brenneria sp. g21c3]